MAFIKVSTVEIVKANPSTIIINDNNSVCSFNNNVKEPRSGLLVESIEKELNWGAEKLRDDITCMAININNTELIKKK